MQILLYIISAIGPAVLLLYKLHSKTRGLSHEKMEQAVEQWTAKACKVAQLLRDNQDHTEALDDLLYLYDTEKSQHGNPTLLFKPTLATNPPIRTTRAGAKAYFVGGDPQFPDDTGFLRKVKNIALLQEKHTVIEQGYGKIMGQYEIEDHDGNITRADYTFAVHVYPNQLMKFTLHHSSISVA